MSDLLELGLTPLFCPPQIFSAHDPAVVPAPGGAKG
jgi:hypothetical protein